MNRQDFIKLLHSKSTESNINKKFSVFSNITFDDSEHPYTTTANKLLNEIKIILDDTPFSDMLPDYDDIYQLTVSSDYLPFEEIDQNQINTNSIFQNKIFQAYISFNDLYDLINDKHSINNNSKNTTVFRIETKNEQNTKINSGIYTAALKQLFYTMTQKLIQHHYNTITETTNNDNNTINQINSSDETLSLIHNPIKEHNKIIKKLNEKINTPEQLLTQSEINQILKECHKLNILIPDEYQFFMNDSHKILNPYEDGILKAIFNKFPIGHTQKNKWHFAFNNKLDLLQWIKDAKTHKALIDVNAHITQYEINDSYILHSDMQNTFLIEKASVIQSKNYKTFL